MSGTATKQGSKPFKRLELELARLRDPECTLCPLHSQTSRVCVMGNGPSSKNPSLVVVGEAPGAQEEATGLLLSGSAGTLLWNLLKPLGFQRENFLVTNAVKCRPEGNETPRPAQIKTCRDAYLWKELEIVSPSHGLVLGNVGLSAVLGKKGITKWNGQQFEAHGITWTAAVHPAAVLRNPKYRPLLEVALLSFQRQVYGAHGQPTTEAILVDTKDRLRDLISRLKSAKSASIDIEAWGQHPGSGRFKGGGLAWWDSTWRIVSLNISVGPGRGYVVPLHHVETPWKNPQRVIEILKPYLEAVPKWYMHNGQYDRKGLLMAGIDLQVHTDTMGAQYAIDENTFKDLGLLSKQYLGAEDYKDTVNKADLFNAPLPDLVEYGARDSDYTFRLASVVLRRLRKSPTSYRLYRTLLMPAMNVLADIEIQGLPVHRGKFAQRWIECTEHEQEWMNKIHEIAGYEVNPRSPDQLASLLFGKLDLPVIHRTGTGKPSTAEDTLVELLSYDSTGVIDAIQQYRHWAGYGSRYFSSWDGLMDERNRLHTHFKPFHTVTGRLSSEHPNLQQIARDTFIRGMIGGRKGWTFVEVDYSQVELRVVAHLSQDSAMLRAFSSGRDIHMETAIAVTGKQEKDITSEERKMAKSVNFGFVYGMGYRKYVQYAKTNYGIDVSEEEAKFFRERFFRTFKGLLPWHDRQRRKAQERKYVLSPIGRIRHLWDIDSSDKAVAAEAERQAINSPVQSFASDMMLLSMILLHDELDPRVARIVSTVHDAILFEIRDEAVPDVLPYIKKRMVDLPLEEMFDVILTVPIEVEAKVGPFWSEGANVI